MRCCVGRNEKKKLPNPIYTQRTLHQRSTLLLASRQALAKVAQRPTSPAEPKKERMRTRRSYDSIPVFGGGEGDERMGEEGEHQQTPLFGWWGGVGVKQLQTKGV